MGEYKNPFSDREDYYEHAEWIDDQITNYFQDTQITVFHEIPTLDLHLNVYLVTLNNSTFNSLITSGMSTLSMNVSEIEENSQDYSFAELMMLIQRKFNLTKFIQEIIRMIGF